jgi:hypothetical protein
MSVIVDGLSAMHVGWHGAAPRHDSLLPPLPPILPARNGMRAIIIRVQDGLLFEVNQCLLADLR